ncbi:hypothetical protein [Streptomyces olivochromogenes]|nr:hypothetical protein [Streptomyces olivochromogenes]
MNAEDWLADTRTSYDPVATSYPETTQCTSPAGAVMGELTKGMQ